MVSLKRKANSDSASNSAQFAPESRPLKRVKASAANQENVVNEAAAAKVDEDPATMPQREPNPAPQDASLIGTPAASPYTAVLHEGEDLDDEPDKNEFGLNDDETASTGLTSVTSSIYYAHTFENGRRYQHFKNGRYPIPNDDMEIDREDMKHAMLMELCNGRLFYAPIPKNSQKILDVGTGSGIWAIEVGDQFPSACVRGIDLSPTQPVWVPPNVDFLVDDCEQGDWVDQDADFIHFRFMTIVLKDVQDVLGHAYESLKPGGWVELQELCAEILCDDGTMAKDDPVKHMYDLVQCAFKTFDMDVTVPKSLESMLHRAGFDNVQCVVKKVPIGPWARDKTLRDIGTYQKMAVQGLMPALAVRPFTALGLSPIESEVTLALARHGLNDLRVHRYFNYYFWFAQKPLM